ncbi:hypothetical protein A8B75_15320 [Sphingomonadales bacterium EhC05]|nr:hypothetical protein A8B75_15320 [Sphingomonadales bacterium EhC05]
MPKQSTVKSPERKLGRPFGKSSDETKKRLIQAAAVHFNAQSFGEVSLSKIAKSAGMTGAAIYNHFGSKEELFIETVKQHIQAGIHVMSKASQIQGSWKQRLNNMLTVIGEVQKHENRFPLITSVAQARMVREPEKYAEIIDLRNEHSLIFQSLVADAIAAGDFPESIDIVIAGDLLMALTVNGIRTVSFYHPEPRDTEQIIAAVRILLGLNP